MRDTLSYVLSEVCYGRLPETPAGCSPDQISTDQWVPVPDLPPCTHQPELPKMDGYTDLQTYKQTVEQAYPYVATDEDALELSDGALTTATAFISISSSGLFRAATVTRVEAG